MIWQLCTFGLTQASDNPTRGNEIANPMMLKSSTKCPDSRRTVTAFSRCGRWPCQREVLCLIKTALCLAQERSVQSTEQCSNLALLLPRIALSQLTLAMLLCQCHFIFPCETWCEAVRALMTYHGQIAARLQRAMLMTGAAEHGVYDLNSPRC